MSDFDDGPAEWAGAALALAFDAQASLILHLVQAGAIDGEVGLRFGKHMNALLGEWARRCPGAPVFDDGLQGVRGLLALEGGSGEAGLE